MENFDNQEGSGTTGTAPAGGGFNPDFGKILARVQLTITDPKGVWEVAKAENATLKSLFVDYLVILAAITPVCTFIGFSLLGLGGVVGGFMGMVIQYLGALLSAFVLIILAEKLAPSFDAMITQTDAAKLVIHASMPSMAAGVLFLFPALAPLAIIPAIYSLYLLWIGLKEMSTVSQEKHPIYFGVLLVSAMILMTVIAMLMP